MATLKRQIPVFGFPHQYDTIVFSADAPCEFAISSNAGGVLLKLSPNALGEIRIEDFAQVLRDFTADGKARDFTLSWEQNSQKFTVLPCRFELSSAAISFVYTHFLTLQQGAKPTYLGAQEFVTLYSALPSRDAFSLSLLWANPQTGEVRETSLSEE